MSWASSGSGQRPLHRLPVRRSGKGAEGHGDLAGGRGVQIHLQLQPGGEGGLLRGELTLLCVDGVDARFVSGDAFRSVQGFPPGLIVKELPFGDLGPGRKQTALGRCIAVQKLQRGAQSVGASSGVRQSGVIHPDEGAPVRILQAVGGLPDLHAAQMLELAEKLLPVGGHAKQPQAFHFDNGH